MRNWMHCVNITSTKHIGIETRRKQASYDVDSNLLKKQGIKELEKRWCNNKTWAENATRPKKINSVVLVRERTKPTERPPLVGEVSANFCGYRVSRGRREGSLRPYSSLSRQDRTKLPAQTMRHSQKQCRSVPSAPSARWVLPVRHAVYCDSVH
jgi:hypothetical protein